MNSPRVGADSQGHTRSGVALGSMCDGRADASRAEKAREGLFARQLSRAICADFLRLATALLLECNHAERPRLIVVRTSGEEKFVGGTVASRAAAELNPPELVDGDVFTVCIFDRPDELTVLNIESVDGAAVRVVRDEQTVAERPKILGRDGEAPGLVEGRAARELLNECSVLLEDIDDSARCRGYQGKGHVEESIDVLDAKGTVACGQSGIGKCIDEVEVSVVHLAHIVGKVGGI